MKNTDLDFTVRDRILAILDAEARNRAEARDDYKDSSLSNAFIAGYTESALSNIRAILEEV